MGVLAVGCPSRVGFVKICNDIKSNPHLGPGWRGSGFKLIGALQSRLISVKADFTSLIFDDCKHERHIFIFKHGGLLIIVIIFLEIKRKSCNSSTMSKSGQVFLIFTILLLQIKIVLTYLAMTLRENIRFKPFMYMLRTYLENKMCGSKLIVWPNYSCSLMRQNTRKTCKQATLYKYNW